VAEMGIMYVYPAIAKRWSAKTLLTVAFAATAFRWAVLATVSSELPIAVASLLHALTFGVYYSTMIAAVSARVPPELRATGQALFAATTSGVGGSVGYVLTGVLSDHVSGHALFGLAAAVELVALFLITRLSKHETVCD